jgi:dihydrodipicolinate reductase
MNRRTLITLVFFFVSSIIVFIARSNGIRPIFNRNSTEEDPTVKATKDPASVDVIGIKLNKLMEREKRRSGPFASLDPGKFLTVLHENNVDIYQIDAATFDLSKLKSTKSTSPVPAIEERIVNSGTGTTTTTRPKRNVTGETPSPSSVKDEASNGDLNEKEEWSSTAASTVLDDLSERESNSSDDETSQVWSVNSTTTTTTTVNNYSSSDISDDSDSDIVIDFTERQQRNSSGYGFSSHTNKSNNVSDKSIPNITDEHGPPVGSTTVTAETSATLAKSDDHSPPSVGESVNDGVSQSDTINKNTPVNANTTISSSTERKKNSLTDDMNTKPSQVWSVNSTTTTTTTTVNNYSSSDISDDSDSDIVIDFTERQQRNSSGYGFSSPTNKSNNVSDKSIPKITDEHGPPVSSTTVTAETSSTLAKSDDHSPPSVGGSVDDGVSQSDTINKNTLVNANTTISSSTERNSLTDDMNTKQRTPNASSNVLDRFETDSNQSDDDTSQVWSVNSTTTTVNNYSSSDISDDSDSDIVIDFTERQQRNGSSYEFSNPMNKSKNISDEGIPMIADEHSPPVGSTTVTTETNPTLSKSDDHSPPSVAGSIITDDVLQSETINKNTLVNANTTISSSTERIKISL